MTSEKFHDLFGGPPRKPESPLTQRDMDLAASVQKVCEEVMLALARQAKKVTGADYLSMAGGCALNCVANGLISREGIFKKLFIQPAAGDAGGSLGAALMAWHQIYEKPRAVAAADQQRGSYLGPVYEDSAIATALKPFQARLHTFAPETLPDQVAELIAQGKVIGLFYGQMEFGPRALGARSIIGDARRPDMQTVMNVKIKFRESFRPFAPAVLEEKMQDYFDIRQETPYMLLVGPVRESQRLAQAAAASKGREGIELLNIPRSTIPAVTHVDYSARVQSLTRDRNGMFYDIVKAFDAKTGCPVVINTSFNIRGEPIVNTPEEAYRCFMLTDMDVLVLQHSILYKEEQPPMAGMDEYKKQFKLD